MWIWIEAGHHVESSHGGRGTRKAYPQLLKGCARTWVAERFCRARSRQSQPQNMEQTSCGFEAILASLGGRRLPLER